MSNHNPRAKRHAAVTLSLFLAISWPKAVFAENDTLRGGTIPLGLSWCSQQNAGSLGGQPLTEDSAPDSGQRIHAGGLVDETGVTLVLYAADLDPDELTKLLGVPPTRAARVGQRAGPRSPPAKLGVWLYETRARAPTEPNALCSELLSQFPSDPEFWQSLASRFDIVLWISVTLKRWNRGFSLAPDVIHQISNTGAKLEFDVYAELGESDIDS